MNDFPYVAPPPDGLQRAFADARGRRLRKAGLSTSTVAACLAVLALVVGGQGTQSLVQQPSPQQPAVSQLVPDGREQLPSAVRPNQGHSVQVYGTDQQRTTTAGGAVAGGERQAQGPAVLQDRHTSPGTPRPPYVAGPIDRRDSRPTDPMSQSYVLPSCVSPDAGQADPGLCTTASVYPAAGPASYEFQAQVCSSSTSLTLLHFPGRNEVDMVVAQKGQEVWRWSRWHTDGGAAHTIGVEGQSCTSWTFDWTGVDNLGRRLPQGSYTLQVTFLAKELRTQRLATYDFSVS